MEPLEPTDLQLLSKEHWERIGKVPHHGIAIPLFSLNTESSLGIGEYGDLPLLIDLVANLNMDVIQLLPLNDCGRDPSPYNALSSTALNPLYLTLKNLPFLQNYPLLKTKLHTLESLKTVPFVDYPKVRAAKKSFLNDYLALTLNHFIELPDYQAFLGNNSFLYTYALFSFLKERHGGRRWARWEKPFIHLTPKEASLYLHQYQKEVEPHLILQYLCFLQLRSAKSYAEKRGIFLKGDIPILLSRNSADVWAHPSWFDLSLDAGAPPDPYSLKGQNWHFPIFNWDNLKACDYLFWRERLRFASYFFHLDRIDHIVGLFRIWAIEKGRSPLEGRFIPENPSDWGPQGEEILKLVLEASPLLPIAEDLGTIPEITYTTLKKLAICGTKVMRWQRYYAQDSRFIPLENYPMLSLTTTSTHDSEPLKLWWQRFPKDAEQFCKDFGINYKIDLSFDVHVQILKMAHSTPSLFHINPLQDYLTLFPELSHQPLEKEIINTPGLRSRRNWTYRIKPTLEQLQDHGGFIGVTRGVVGIRRTH